MITKFEFYPEERRTALENYVAEYTFEHLGLDPSLRDHVSFGHFESGHMMYIHDPSRADLKRDVVEFLEASL